MLSNNLSYEEHITYKQHNRFPNLKANLPLCLLLYRSDSIIFFMGILISNLYYLFLKTPTKTIIVKQTVLGKIFTYY